MKRFRRAAGPLMALCAALLVGCAGTQTFHRMQEASGQIRLDTCDGPECDYKVAIQNRSDIGWDGEVQADRLKAISLLLGGDCDDVVLVSESIIERGTYTLSTKPARTYVMKVRCPKSGPSSQAVARP